MEIKANDLDSLYTKIIREILNEGEITITRDMKVKEIKGVHLVLNNPRSRIITNSNRKMDIALACGELLWYLSGDDSLDFINFYNKRYKNFSDDGKKLHGSYGKRIFSEKNGESEWKMAKQRLLNDNGTRQAVISIFRTETDISKDTKDVPCTLNIHFMIRDGKLDCFISMRSNDVIWGLPYDIFTFTVLQELMAQELGVDLGKYYHYVNSMHIYEYHFEFSKKILEGEQFKDYQVVLNTGSFNNIQGLLEQERSIRDDKRINLSTEYELFNDMILILNLRMLSRTGQKKLYYNKVNLLHYPLNNLMEWKE